MISPDPGPPEPAETPWFTAPSEAGPLPLSASQAWPWYLSQLAPDSTAHHELITIRKAGPLDVGALRCALTVVIARHEALRTTFRTIDGVVRQFVGEPVEVELPVTDLSDLGCEEAIRRATEIVAAHMVRPYDLADGPLIRPLLVRIAEDDHRLYLGLHQLIFDGPTLHRVVFPELTALYRSYVIGVPSPLPDPLSQYDDYTMWELDWIRGPEIADRIDRWRSRLAVSTPTQLPFDHPRAPRRTFAGGTIPMTIERSTVDGLRRAAQRAGGNLFDALAAAYAWWLHMYVDSTEVSFGSQHDLRDHDDPPEAAGHCVTPMVLRCDVSGHESFTALVGRMRSVVSEAVSDAVPFDALLDGLGVTRDPHVNPHFQTAMLFQPVLSADTDNWSLHAMEADVRDAMGSAKFDLSIELDERPEGHVVGGFVFSTDLFDRETAREMASLWRRLLDTIAAAPEIPMAGHNLVIPEELRRQLSWYPTTQGVLSQCVHEVISAQAKRTPDAVAVQVGSATLTYRQLDDRAKVIASQLIQAGAGSGTVVAVLLARTPDLVAAILGILKSGAAFLPLDPRQPDARKSFCINDVGATLVLTDQQLPAGEDSITATVINIGDLASGAAHDDFWFSPVSSTELAYVICTSGSTGRPKPVLIEHRSMANLMHTWPGEVGVGASDTVLSVAAISFDLALGDVFCALGCGARLVLATTEQATDPAALSRLIADSGATYMCATPTTWAALLATGWSGDRGLTVVTGGETVNDGLAQALLHRCGSVWNAYGPTEATVWTNVVRLAEGDAITVGRPLPNVRVYITDGRGRLQPVGVPGEISIGGVAVARGYLNRPDELARRFGEDPFHAGGRVYRTGDRGRFLPDGRIQHLGRYDEQVKIRGFRIEPGEIESVLCEHPDVGCCAVVAREAPNGDKQLVAYIVGEHASVSDAEAREWLGRRLPQYMVPSAFVNLRALPTTPSGKLDKAALPPPSGAGRCAGAQTPRSETETRIATMWADLLAMPVTDIDSDFFEMGGHSLLAARLLADVQRTFGVALSPAAFVEEGRTVAKLTELIGAENLSKTGGFTSERPLHFIFADAASAMSVRHFTTLWGAALPVHALMPEQPDGRFDLSVTVEQLACQLLSMIRNRQPEGPLAIVGYSVGGVVAYEIARQAAAAGQQVEWLGVLDMTAPSMPHLQQAEMSLWWRLRRIRRLPRRERWAKYREIALRVLRSGELLPESDFDYWGATEIVNRYRQPGHELPMHLFVGAVSAVDEQDDLLGWDGYHKGRLAVDRLAGDHATLLQPPQVERLAQAMIESLGKARESTRVERRVTTLGGRHRKRRQSSTATGAVNADALDRVVVPISSRLRG